MGNMERFGLGGNTVRKTTLLLKYMEDTHDLKRCSGHRGKQVKWKIQGSIYIPNIKMLLIWT